MASRRRRGDITGTSDDNKASGYDVIGASDPAVKLYQQQLIVLGYLPSGSDTGVADAASIAAVKAFQKDAKIGVDGKVGPITNAALVKAITAKASVPTTQQSLFEGTPAQVDPNAIGNVLQQGAQMIPGGVPIPGVPGGIAIPGMTSIPGASQVLGPVGVVGPQTQVAQAPTASPPVDDDKIMGLPKNVVIGGGVTLGVLALIGLIMYMRKDKESDSKSEKSSGYRSYVDHDGTKWIMDPTGVVYRAGYGKSSAMSESLSERINKLQMHRRHG